MLILTSSIICNRITVQSIYILCWLSPPSNSVPSATIVIEHHSRSGRCVRLAATAVLLLLLLLLLWTIVVGGGACPVGNYSRFSSIVLLVIRIVVDGCAVDVSRCIRLGQLCPCIVDARAGAPTVGRSVGQLVVVIVVEVVLTAAPRLLRTDLDATRFVIIAFRMAIGVGLAGRPVPILIVVVVVVRAKVPIPLRWWRLLLLVVPCPGGIVVARAQNGRRMFKLVGVIVGAAPVSPVFLLVPLGLRLWFLLYC